MKKTAGLFVAIATIVLATQAQSKENVLVVEKAMQLNSKEEFSELVKLFDTAGKRQVPPFLLYSAWNSLTEQYGNYRKSSVKTSYIKKNIEYIIEEVEFDSGYAEIKFSFSAANRIKSYLLVKTTTKAHRLLEQKYRMPAYANSKNVNNKPVSFGAAPFIMQGELTLPKNLKKNEKIPAIVLVQGSGPGDMDEKAGPQQPFRDIAYGLANRGIAVIRYDKRTLSYVEECTEDNAFDVNKETVYDALEAVKYLKTLDNIDTNRIIVLGHSLGGMMMPRIAATDTTIAACIFMAAPAKSFPDKVIEQMDYLAGLYPNKKTEYEKAKEDFVRLKTKWYDSATNPRYLPYGLPPGYWMDLDTYNQTEEVKKIKRPMLFLQGGRDYQVTVVDFDMWKETLKGRKNVSFALFKSLSHNMMTGTATPSPDDYNIPANVSQEVIETIEGWVKGL